MDETEVCETGKSIHQTNESVMFYPPLPLPPNVIRLLAFSLVALDRSTVLMALLAHKPAKERCRTRDRRTNGDGETKDPERKEPRQKNEGALFYRRERTRRIGKEEGEKRKDMLRVERTEGTTREGVVRCGQICWGLVSPGFIFHKLCTGVTHTQDEDSSESRSCVSSDEDSSSEIFNDSPPHRDRKL